MADTVATATPDGRAAELAALDDLAVAVDENARDERLLARSIRRLKAGRAKGRSWNDLLDAEQRPGALELVSRILRRIMEASGSLRRAVARGLRLEGATIPAIAALFGVSHQRISALLRRSDKSPPT